MNDPALQALTPDDLREALRVCFDPELAINIVDLGLIEKIVVEQDREAPGLEPRFHVHLTLLSRTEDEQRGTMLRAQVENRLMGMREVSRTSIELATTVPWTAERMSSVARRQLGLDRPATPTLVQIHL